jgi:nuclease A inhibitor-like protein
MSPAATQTASKPFRARLAHALSALVADEPNWWSESLQPGDWDPFHAPLDPATPLTAESFRACAREAASRTISARPFGDYLDYVLGPANLGEPSVSTWRAFQQIAELVLSDRTIFSVGENELTRVRTYLLGRIADGSVVGIHAVTVETS